MRLALLLAFAAIIWTTLFALWMGARMDDLNRRLTRIEAVVWGVDTTDW